MGKTHVFIKRSFGTVIEVLRNVKVTQMNNAATTVQSKFKGLRQCRRYRMLLNKIAHIQAMWRGFYLRKQWQVRMHAIIKIQTRLRGLVPRLRFLTIKRACTMIQKNYRRYRMCRMYRFQLRGLKALQHLAKGYVIRVRLSRLVEAARLVQRRWRGHVTVHRYLKAKTKVCVFKCDFITLSFGPVIHACTSCGPLLITPIPSLIN
jgi:myosin heavy subunit